MTDITVSRKSFVVDTPAGKRGERGKIESWRDIVSDSLIWVPVSWHCDSDELYRSVMGGEGGGAGEWG